MGRSKYSKSELFLMEFIVVILFFAISISICISAFVRANNISEDSMYLNRALTLAQTIAEDIKGSNKVEIIENTTFYNSDFFVKISQKMDGNMLDAKIQVYYKEDVKKEICELEVKKYLPNGV